ncbi:MAG: hypothetical protein LQ352_000793 [Teloschistes flavicans]|nr:MAG: hypothetical protein LQ352_000793 [Teloschistes flavicans]
MAKTKPGHAAKDNKARTFSTSAVFKNTKPNSNPDNQKRLVGLRLCPGSTKSKPKRTPKLQNPRSVAFNETILESRQAVEERTLSRLEKVHDGLVGQTHEIMKHTRQRIGEAENHENRLQRPLDDELLELTRKDGSITTVTLGERMKAYRRLLAQERKSLEGLFEQVVEVSQKINAVAITLCGLPEGQDRIKDLDTGRPGKADAELRALKEKLKAEGERAKSGTFALGAKAVKSMTASEKDLDSKQKTRMLQLCERMFDDDDGEVAA